MLIHKYSIPDALDAASGIFYPYFAGLAEQFCVFPQLVFSEGICYPGDGYYKQRFQNAFFCLIESQNQGITNKLNHLWL
jgi:hypothetical protein